MEYYNTTPQPARHPTHPAYHHSASANAPHYQNSAYALPTTHNQPAQTMPTYYVSGGSPSSHHLSRSYSHNTHQPVVYTTSSGSRQYLSPRDYAYADTGRRRRSSSVGHGGHYHTTGHSSSSNRRSNSRTPVYYTGSSPSHRRSHSTTRHHGTSSHNYSTGRHSSSAHRPSGVYSDSGNHYSQHRRHSDSLGDRFRRWFGIGSWGHQSSRGFQYEDARTGRPVDRSGRPIYRV